MIVTSKTWHNPVKAGGGGRWTRDMLCGSLEDELRENVVLQPGWGQAFDEHWL